jgi:hypothetical protein
MTGKRVSKGARSAPREHEFAKCSSVYRWLRARYEELARELQERAPGWKAIAARIAADGIRGVRGGEPNAESVRRVWQRVCRDVEKGDRASVAQRTSKPFYPSRVRSTWRPEPIPDQRSTPGLEPLAPVAAARPRTTAEKLAEVRRDLEKRSGR